MKMCSFLFNRYTKSGSVDEPALYAIVLDWPAEGSITLGDPKLATDAAVTLLGYENPLQVSI